MSRFIRLERPLMSPGECMVCKSYALPVVDFNVTIQAFNGKLYLCEECITEAMTTIVPNAFEDSNADWEAYAHKLEEKVKELHAGLTDLSDNSAQLLIVASSMPDVPVVSVDESKPGAGEGNKRDGKDTEGGTGKSKSNDKKPGPNDVSSLNLDELLGS